jgi:hypothetical protein
MSVRATADQSVTMTERRIEALVEPWFQLILADFASAGLSSAEGDSPEQQEQKERQGTEFKKNVRKWFANGKQNFLTKTIVRQVLKLLGSREAVAKRYAADPTTVSKWAHGTTTAPRHVYEEMVKDWVQQLRVPAPADELAHGYIFTLNKVRESIEGQERFHPLNREVWEMLLHAWLDPAWSQFVREPSKDELECLFQAIRTEVQAIPEVAGQEEKEPPKLRIWNWLLLEGTREEWEPFFRLTLGARSKELI